MRAAVTAKTARSARHGKNLESARTLLYYLHYPLLLCTVFRVIYWHSLCKPRFVLLERKNQTIKTRIKTRQKSRERIINIPSTTLCYPTIPLHSKMKSKQSTSRDNPGKYSTLARGGGRTGIRLYHPQLAGARYIIYKNAGERCSE